MGKYSRQEIEDAFDKYQQTALKAGTSGDWNPWADLFTEDATYIEHLFGTFGGREAIRNWISSTMAEYPHCEMKYFPVEWYIIDEERGWVVYQVWNRMVDPGDGSLHQSYNYSLLKYAGHGLWSFEEDIYNPKPFQDMIRGWLATKRTCEGKGGLKC